VKLPAVKNPTPLSDITFDEVRGLVLSLESDNRAQTSFSCGRTSGASRHQRKLLKFEELSRDLAHMFGYELKFGSAIHPPGFGGCQTEDSGIAKIDDASKCISTMGE
jgi:hypothetical protein